MIHFTYKKTIFKIEAVAKPDDDGKSGDEPGPSHGRGVFRRHFHCLVIPHINIFEFTRKFSTPLISQKFSSSLLPNDCQVFFFSLRFAKKFAKYRGKKMRRLYMMIPMNTIHEYGV